MAIGAANNHKIMVSEFIEVHLYKLLKIVRAILEAYNFFAYQTGYWYDNFNWYYLSSILSVQVVNQFRTILREYAIEVIAIENFEQGGDTIDQMKYLKVCIRYYLEEVPKIRILVPYWNIILICL